MKRFQMASPVGGAHLVHKDLKADFILVNPPFNMSPWGHDHLQNRMDQVGATATGVRVPASEMARMTLTETCMDASPHAARVRRYPLAPATNTTHSAAPPPSHGNQPRRRGVSALAAASRSAE